MTKEDFSNELLTALDQSKKHDPPADVLKRMEQFALKQIASKSKFQKLSIVGMAASFLILLSANFYIFKSVETFDGYSVHETEESYDFIIPAKSLYHE